MQLKKKMIAAAAVMAASVAFVVPATAMADDMGSYPSYNPSPEYPSYNPSPDYPNYGFPSGSPSAEDVAKANGSGFYAECTVGELGTSSFQNWVPVKVTYSERQAKNVSLQAGEQVLASFDVELSEDYKGQAPTQCAISWTTPGTDLIGKDAKVFVEHSNGSTEVKEGTIEGEKSYEFNDGQVTESVKNGKIKVNVDGLSIYSLAVDKGVVNNASDESTGNAGAVASTSAAGKKSPVTGVLPASMGGLALMAAIAAAGVLRKSLAL